MITKSELIMINTYASIELAGALAAGKRARKISDPYLKEKLTWHCAEESRHATMLYEAMKKARIPIMNIHNKGEKKSYWIYASEVEDIDEFLCLCHVFELRAPFHYQIHKNWTKIPEIREVMSQLIVEEGPHLEWIKDYLLNKSKKSHAEIKELLNKSFDAENKSYSSDMSEFDNSEEVKDLMEEIKKKSIEFEKNIRESYFTRWDNK